MARWLQTTAETAANRSVRVTYLLTLGRSDEAIATIGRIEPSGPFERFEVARLLAAADFETGGRGDLGPARLACRAIDDPAGRSIAVWQLALEDARQRYVLGGDWRAPLTLAAGAGDSRAATVRAWLPTLIWGAAPLLAVIYVLALALDLVATGSVV